VPVHLDPELRAAVEARASAEQTSTSEIIREALRRCLEVAWSRTENGRTGRKKDGKHRSSPVTPGHQRTLENRF
jgi:hypothetical protein